MMLATRNLLQTHTPFLPAPPLAFSITQHIICAHHFHTAFAVTTLGWRWLSCSRSTWCKC
jgi:hypothetical protein